MSPRVMTSRPSEISSQAVLLGSRLSRDWSTNRSGVLRNAPGKRGLAGSVDCLGLSEVDLIGWPFSLGCLARQDLVGISVRCHTPPLAFTGSNWAFLVTNRQAMIGSLSGQGKLPPLTLVVGGARSGKSRLAENLVVSCGLKRHYIATAEAWDDEMHARIAQHQIDRGPEWQTLNAHLDLDKALAAIPGGEVVLLDCVTLWLSNHLLLGSDIGAKCMSLIAALSACASPVVTVSNEVGWGIVPENSVARAFRDHQGRLNQLIAERADLVIGVMAGLPIVLKGQIPGRSIIHGDTGPHN